MIKKLWPTLWTKIGEYLNLTYTRFKSLFLMDYFEFFENGEHRLLRSLPDYTNPMSIYSEKQFESRFRLQKHSVIAIYDLISSEPHNNRGNPVPDIIQVQLFYHFLFFKHYLSLQLLVSIRYFATGTFQREIGDLFKISQPSVCRSIHNISKKICLLRESFIKFPVNNGINEMKTKFYQVAHFPGVVGAIDGTHVPIKKPSSSDYEEYRCRKGYFSINVQGVSAYNLKFTNIVARWKGSTHDSRIWQNSSLFHRFDTQNVNGFLLGDNGYACNNHLLTPLLNPSTDSERRYNSAHIRTRNTVERLFGVWKSRFYCLQKGLLFKPKKCCNIIIATAILHNIAVDHNESMDFAESQYSYQDGEMNITNNVVSNSSARSRVINEHFSLN